MEQGYWSSEMAKILDIAPVTLRKWSIALEREGYIFIRDENGRRAYRERDILPLKSMKQLLASNTSIENASKALSKKYKEEQGTLPVLQSNEEFERSQERYFNMIIDQLNNANRTLIERIDTLEESNQKIIEYIERIENERAERERSGRKLPLLELNGMHKKILNGMNGFKNGIIGFKDGFKGGFKEGFKEFRSKMENQSFSEQKSKKDESGNIAE